MTTQELLEELIVLAQQQLEVSKKILAALGAAPRAASPAPSNGGAVFPNYGRNKGQPIAGAAMEQLMYYADGCRRTLSDVAKERWHDKERVLLAALEAEIARQGGVVSTPEDFGPPIQSAESDSVPF